jgi:hypothetical protein
MLQPAAEVDDEQKDEEMDRAPGDAEAIELEVDEVEPFDPEDVAQEHSRSGNGHDGEDEVDSDEQHEEDELHDEEDIENEIDEEDDVSHADQKSESLPSASAASAVDSHRYPASRFNTQPQRSSAPSGAPDSAPVAHLRHRGGAAPLYTNPYSARVGPSHQKYSRYSTQPKSHEAASENNNRGLSLVVTYRSGSLGWGPPSWTLHTHSSTRFVRLAVVQATEGFSK